MSISQYKKHAETLLLRMQFFCLDPKYSNYTEICEYPKIQHEQSEYLDIWKLACLTQYGLLWDIPEDEWEEHKKEFADETHKLYSRLLIRPTSVNLDRMWYIFFATGDINALRAAFEVSGNSDAKKDLQIAASDQFANFRDEYQRKIDDALKKDPNYFRNHEVFHDVPEEENSMISAQTVFDRFQQEINSATQRLEDGDEGEVRGILTRLGVEEEDSNRSSVDKFMSNMFGSTDGVDMNDEAPEGETEEEKEMRMKEKDRIGKLAVRFDEIAKDVLKDKYVTKSNEDTPRRNRHRK